jgi:hypothetical protein
MTWPGWEHELLGALGISPTRSRLSFLRAWARCEGGRAHFNPLNTTFELAGSRRYNSAGVQSYLDRYQGLAATLLTLRLDYYRELLYALRTPGLSAAAIAEQSHTALATWGTGSRCIRSIVG